MASILSGELTEELDGEEIEASDEYGLLDFELRLLECKWQEKLDGLTKESEDKHGLFDFELRLLECRLQEKLDAITEGSDKRGLRLRSIGEWDLIGLMEESTMVLMAESNECALLDREMDVDGG